MAEDLRIEIGASVLAAFPQARVFALRAIIPDQGALAGQVAGLASEMVAAEAALLEVEPITALPEIALWRKAYGKLGVKPSKFPSSIEALLRRARKGQMAEIGIPAVDLYNRVSVIHRVPMGAYDVARLGQPPLMLRHADPASDRFAPLGGDPASFPLNPDLVVYAQDRDVLCWGFNTRDSARTAVESGSRDIAFFSETPVAEGGAAAEAALLHLSQLISDGGGQCGPLVQVSGVEPAGVILPIG